MIQEVFRFEERILLLIQEYIREPHLTPVMKVVTKLGDAGIFWVLLTAVLLLFRQTRYIGICSFYALVLSFLLNNVLLKNIVARMRPYEAIPELESLVGRMRDYSFPSGHSAASFASASAIGLSGKAGKRSSIILITLAGVISFSRLYVGVHYPTDVFFGILSGLLCAAAAVRLAEKTYSFTQRKKEAKKGS